jgi:radical SAM protein (TIGR01212 family)
MTPPATIHTFGRAMRAKYGEPVHKIALNVGMTCPNRDGSKGTGGCTFCDNRSFSPHARAPAALAEQLAAGKRAVHRVSGARRFIAYFQAYTNTYAEIDRLRALYDEALADPDVIGLSIGTRPDCVPAPVLDLLADYRAQGRELWLELGLQSAFDATLARVNRGHGWREYEDTARAARARGIPVCTHLIVGLPGEDESHFHATLDAVLDVGTDGLKLHPLHVVRHTRLALQWQRGEFQPPDLRDYVRIAADLIERTPQDVIYHRVTGTASPDILLAPSWCSSKWPALNGIEAELARRGSRQGDRCGEVRHAGARHAA